MLVEQKNLDTVATQPYTCLVSLHSKPLRRVNFLMNLSRRSAHPILNRVPVFTGGSLYVWALAAGASVLPNEPLKLNQSDSKNLT